MAHMRYLAWADKADTDGFANVARLFRAISRAEQAHATSHFKAMRDDAGAFLVAAGGGFGLGTTSENLSGAIEGETFEIEQMYPTYLEVAKFQGESAAVKSIEYAVSAEKIHATMYTAARQAVDAGSDVALRAIQVCTVCGHTLEGDSPDTCPVCGARKEKYVTFA